MPCAKNHSTIGGDDDMSKEVKNISASIRAKLQNNARETNRPFAEVLQYYGIERFLYRVSTSKHSGVFILKGALLFTAWQIEDRRTTLDIDLLARFDNKVESIENLIVEICKTNVISDGLVFDPASVKGERIKEDADYEGVRVKFTGFLERARIRMQIDIAFGDSVYPRPKMIQYPVILDLPHPKLKGYPGESVISEKFEAMIKLGVLNSRMKDFYDIWLMIRQFDFDGVKVADALRKTFIKRKTSLPQKKPLLAEEFYDETSDKQKMWVAFLNKNNATHVPQVLATVVHEIEGFLIKPIDAINKKDIFDKKWFAAKTWK